MPFNNIIKHHGHARILYLTHFENVYNVEVPSDNLNIYRLRKKFGTKFV